MVKVQAKLIEYLEITKIKMVIGGSMGGMLVLEWVAQHPTMIESCVPIASTTKVSPLVIAFDAVGRNSILKQIKSGNGNSGLAVARQLEHITYLSEEALEKSFLGIYKKGNATVILCHLNSKLRVIWSIKVKSSLIVSTPILIYI